MAAARTGADIALTGPPHNASAVVAIEPSGDRVVPVTLQLAGGPAMYRASVRPLGAGTSELRLKLPRETAPGTYTGQATVGGAQRAVVVEVEPVVRIQIQPKRTSFSGAPGSRSPFKIVIANGGNVPFDVPKSSALDLDSAEGQDRALGRSLRATLGPGERRVDRFFEELRDDHGGEARVVVTEGAGALGAGESRGLSCLLEIPDTAQVGRSYLGAWQLANASHVVVVDAVKGSSPTPRAGQTALRKTR